MAKVLEGPGMGLMKKWGIHVPNYVVVTSADELAKLGQANDWMKTSKLVAKAHEALGSRFKLGLVKVGLDLNGAVAATKEMIGRQVGSITVSRSSSPRWFLTKKNTIVRSSRLVKAAEILVANCGGIEVESNWDRVKRLCLDVGHTPTPDQLEKLAKEAGFTGPLAKKMADFAGKMFTCFDNEDAQYLEVNPVVTRESDGELVALDAVTLLDGDAKFRHPDWNFQFAAEFGRAYSKDEVEVMAVDCKIKGSVKFIEIPGGDTAMLPAGGGASVYYSDAVVARGGKLANYAEYSGDPPDWAVEVLTEKVCSLARHQEHHRGRRHCQFHRREENVRRHHQRFPQGQGGRQDERCQDLGAPRRAARKRRARRDACAEGRRLRYPRLRPQHAADGYRRQGAAKTVTRTQD